MYKPQMHELEGGCAPPQDQVVRLEEEIATLERRLDDMGIDGDCAYERAMSRVYTGLVEKRKLQLASLRNSP